MLNSIFKMYKILENMTVKCKKKKEKESTWNTTEQWHEKKDNDFLQSICSFLHDVPFFFFFSSMHSLFI